MSKFYTCINTELKLFGLNVIGLSFGILGFIFLWSILSVTVAILGGFIAFYYGTMISKWLHNGKIQRLLYAHLPIKIRIYSYKKYFN